MRRPGSWRNRAELALGAIVLVATASCDAIVGIGDVPPVTDATADTGAPTEEAGRSPDVVDAPSDAGASDADATTVIEASPCGDTQSSAVNCGSCGKACPGAQSCVTGVCQPLVALLPVGSGATPIGLAQDDKYLYWTNKDFNSVMQTDKLLGGSVMLAGGGRSPTAIAANDGDLYWGDEDNVAMCNLPDCIGSTSVLASTSESSVVSVAVDSHCVYWSEGNPAVLRASKDASQDGGLQIAVTLWQGDASVGHVATDGQHVYFTASDGLMRVIDVDGGNEVDLGAPSPGGSFDIALDDASAYWSVSDPAQGVIYRAPLSTFTAATFAAGQSYPASIASDGTHLYWIAGTAKANETTIMGCAIASCTPEVLVTMSTASLSAIAVDDFAIYFVQPASTGGGIWKLPK